MQDSLKIIGDVKVVLGGHVDNDCMKPTDLSQLRFALGAGSFSDCSCTGETIIFNHTGYISRVASNGKLITDRGISELKSAFLMGLEEGSEPSFTIRVNRPLGITLNDLYKELGQDLLAYGIVGHVLFDPLACSYLKTAPIFHEPINANVDKYWATTEMLAPCYGHIFGVVIRQEGLETFPKEALSKAFYSNPLEKNIANYLSHTHAALVSEASASWDTLQPERVTGARHIFTQSVVKEGVFSIFSLRSLKIHSP